MILRARRHAGAWAFVMLMACGTGVSAHGGPPFPIVSNQTAGPYEVSVWTDPDATDDGSSAGRFWVMVSAAGKGVTLPADTRVSVSIWPFGREDSVTSGNAEPVEQEASRQFAALVMDHEGRYGVRATIGGPLGPAAVEAWVDATYDQRPRPILVLVYLMPFALIGFLWLKSLLRRRGLSRGRRTGR